VKCSFRQTVIVLLIVAMTLAPIAAAQTVSGSIPFLHLSASIRTSSGGEPVIVEIFKTTDPEQHSVVCISGLHDLRYQLVTALGTAVSIRQNLNIADTDSQGFMYKRGAPDPCKTRKDGLAGRVIEVVSLYRNLPRGTYKLIITLAPRGRSERAVLAPLRFTY
jgi:hypothetical protein